MISLLLLRWSLLFVLLLMTLHLAAQSRPVADSLVVADTVQLRLAPQLAKPPIVTRADIWRAGIPLALVGLGYLGSHETVVEEFKEVVNRKTQAAFPRFQTSLDDYTRRTPIYVNYALMAVGAKGERGLVPFTLTWGLAHFLNSSTVTKLKKVTQVQRPDRPNDFSSFPSAHTADAFMTATLLHEQFGQESPWISVTGFGIATATGAMRMLNNRHWVTDVVAGASIGFLSAEIAWRVYPLVGNHMPGKFLKRVFMAPVYLPGGGVGAAAAVQL